MRQLITLLLFLVALSGNAQAFQAPVTVTVPAGKFVFGSDRQQREYGYYLDEKAYGHSVTRRQGWYDSEAKLQTISLPAFNITKTPITNGQYEEFLAETRNRRPWVGADTWAGYKLAHPYSSAQRHNWSGRLAPKGRRDHPVVLVAYKDVVAYARWLSGKTGDKWRFLAKKNGKKRFGEPMVLIFHGAMLLTRLCSTAMTKGHMTRCQLVLSRKGSARLA
jgi:formylglycine-generating enzyme required for sulfatase activity